MVHTDTLMYCSECGLPAAGKFCSNCGTSLAEVGTAPPTADWAELVDYGALVQVPEVRGRIDRAAAAASRRMTGDEFLDLADKVFSPFTGVPTSAIAKFAQPISERLGFKTGKSRQQVLPAPPGKVLASVLCSLARRGHVIRQVRQSTDGCTIEAEIAGDIFSLKGDLSIKVARHPSGTSVEAGAVVKGQIYDWGKSHRRLDELFDDVRDAA